MDRRLLLLVLVLVGLMGAGGLYLAVPTVDPGGAPSEVPSATGSSRAGPAAPSPAVGGDATVQHPRQGAIAPADRGDPLGRDQVPSIAPMDDPAKWQSIRGQQAADIAASQYTATADFLDDHDVPNEDIEEVLQTVQALSEELAAVREKVEGGSLSPADGRDAINGARRKAGERVEAILGPETAKALRSHLTANPGGGF